MVQKSGKKLTDKCVFIVISYISAVIIQYVAKAWSSKALNIIITLYKLKYIFINNSKSLIRTGDINANQVKQTDKMWNNFITSDNDLRGRCS